MNPSARYFLAAAAALLPLGAAAADAPPTSGTIAISVAPGDGNADPATSSFVSAAGEALASKGLTILDDPDHAGYVAELVLTRADVGTGSAKVRSRGAGFAPGVGYGAGAGITIPLSAGERRLVAIQRTRLELRIHKRGATDVIWHGAAVTVRAASTPKGGVDTVAADLSTALLRAYPVSVDDVVSVP